MQHVDTYENPVAAREYLTPSDYAIPKDIGPIVLHVRYRTYGNCLKKVQKMRSIDEVLDRAQRVQNVKSDYKLGLCLGIGATALSSYRRGRSLPDEKACIKLAKAMGEDPGVLTAEMQAKRAKDDETRTLWLSIAKRLQAGVSSIKMMLLIAIVSIAAGAYPAWAGLYLAASSVNLAKIYIVEYSTRQADNAGKSRLARKVAEPACGIRTLFQRCSRFTICRWLAVCGRLPQ